MAGGQFFQARSEAAVPQEFVHAAAVGAWGQGQAGAGHVVGEAGEQAVEGRDQVGGRFVGAFMGGRVLAGLPPGAVGAHALGRRPGWSRIEPLAISRHPLPRPPPSPLTTAFVAIPAGTESHT
ncbi:hypothetical protein ADL21_10585 [Streptomyces albus subsp. albus]|nr:hypothetical protein ADL21_10585 [Streptomyces albus subsp. albus]